MRRWLLAGASIALVGVLVAACAQHFRYQHVRRDLAADRQPLLHPSSAFHVVTLLDLAPGQELLSGVREFVAISERGGGTVVYAGKVAANALHSAQVPQHEWDAFVLAQFPSREAYDAIHSASRYRAMREGFANSYALGMQRSPWLNLALPIALLGIRAVDLATFRPSPYPFRPAPVPESSPAERRTQVVNGLLANRAYGTDAVVVLNFTKDGTAEQREANADYARAMLGLMAEMGNGPMHMGRAVTLEGDADFDHVRLVYYPGVEYFADLIQSEFFTGIVGDKQLGDTLSSPTVPLLPHL